MYSGSGKNIGLKFNTDFLAHGLFPEGMNQVTSYTQSKIKKVTSGSTPEIVVRK